MHPDLKKGIGIAVQLAFVALAALMVYGFVKTTGVGRPQPGSAEERRLCLPACILRPDYLDATRIAPDFTLPAIDFDASFRETEGRQVSLSSYRGKVVLMNFWSKDCGPCIQEMQALDDLASIINEKFGGQVVLLTVSFDESAKDIADTLRAILPKPPRFTVLHDAENAVVRPVYGTTLVPETWIIDKRGVVRARFDGARQSESGHLIWAEPTVVELVDQIRSGEHCPDPDEPSGTLQLHGRITRPEASLQIKELMDRGMWKTATTEKQLADIWGVDLDYVRRIALARAIRQRMDADNWHPGSSERELAASWGVNEEYVRASAVEAGRALSGPCERMTPR